jgi:hypothetical protein
VYTDKNSLIEKVILTKFEKCRKNHLNHEWIIDVDLEVLISSVKSIIDFSNLDVTYEDDIESYNKDIELEYKK